MTFPLPSLLTSRLSSNLVTSYLLKFAPSSYFPICKTMATPWFSYLLPDLPIFSPCNVQQLKLSPFFSEVRLSVLPHPLHLHWLPFSCTESSSSGSYLRHCLHLPFCCSYRPHVLCPLLSPCCSLYSLPSSLLCLFTCCFLSLEYLWLCTRHSLPFTMHSHLNSIPVSLLFLCHTQFKYIRIERTHSPYSTPPIIFIVLMLIPLLLLPLFYILFFVLLLFAQQMLYVRTTWAQWSPDNV